MRESILIATITLASLRLQTEAAVDQAVCRPDVVAHHQVQLLAALSSPAASLPTAVAEVDGEETTFEEELLRKTALLMSGQKFDELDKMADAFRSSKAQSAIGTWHLLSFYRVITKLSEDAGEQAWTGRIAFFKNWRAARAGFDHSQRCFGDCLEGIRLARPWVRVL